jgi:hypothetical protein
MISFVDSIFFGGAPNRCLSNASDCNRCCFRSVRIKRPILGRKYCLRHGKSYFRASVSGHRQTANLPTTTVIRLHVPPTKLPIVVSICRLFETRLAFLPVLKQHHPAVACLRIRPRASVRTHITECSFC